MHSIQDFSFLMTTQLLYGKVSYHYKCRTLIQNQFSAANEQNSANEIFQALVSEFCYKHTSYISKFFSFPTV